MLRIPGEIKQMLKDKIGLIMGVANQRSIAWACAQACLDSGAELAFTYQGERLQRYVEKLTADMDDTLLVPCDVTDRPIPGRSRFCG